MKRAQLAVLLAAAVAAGGLGLLAGSKWTAGTATRNVLPAVNVGELAPAISLPDLDDRTHALADYRGRPLLVNFWASWCRPCIEEMPMLDAFAAAQGDNGVQVVGIALDDRAAVEAFLRQTRVRYPILLDLAGPADSSVRLGNARGVLPYSVLIDAQGRVAAQKTGPFTAATLERFAHP